MIKTVRIDDKKVLSKLTKYLNDTKKGFSGYVKELIKKDLKIND